MEALGHPSKQPFLGRPRGGPPWSQSELFTLTYCQPSRAWSLKSVEARATPHETGIWPHFKAFPGQRAGRSWWDEGRKLPHTVLREEKHLASGPETPPFSLTSASLPTEKEDGGLLLPSTSHGLSPGSKPESAPRTGPEESEGTAEALWAVVCVWGGGDKGHCSTDHYTQM